MRVVLTSPTGRTRRMNIERRHMLATIGASLLVILSSIGISTWLGYGYGVSQIEGNVFVIEVDPKPEESLVKFQQDLIQQKKTLADLNEQSSNELRALSQRVGRLQAHIMRIDALGQRVASMADLDDGEFDFADMPAQGGPLESEAETDEPSVSDFLLSLQEFSQQLEDRTEQLSMLEKMVVKSQLDEETAPAGSPITTGWLSSKFGARRDPFDGRVRYHYGVDFASPHGSDVVSVGRGIVSEVKDRRGYGLLVEVTHGEGFVTRYAHNSAVTVEKGETVERGQVIAKVGQSGRSTGPHVHFEVLYNGVQVDPAQYVVIDGTDK